MPRLAGRCLALWPSCACLLAASSPAACSHSLHPPNPAPECPVCRFHAICAGAGVDPGPTFRRLLLDLCPGLLKGPFNDAERQLVGLPAAWYDARLWEPELRDAAAAAVAVASKAEYAGTPAAAAGSAAAALAPVTQPERLQQIAARLAAMLDLEVQTATSA